MAIDSSEGALAFVPHVKPAACTAAEESNAPTTATPATAVLLDLDFPFALAISATAVHVLVVSL